MRHKDITDLAGYSVWIRVQNGEATVIGSGTGDETVKEVWNGKGKVRYVAAKVKDEVYITEEVNVIEGDV